MRVLEEAEEDEGFSALVQLTAVEAQKEVLQSERDQAVKAKEQDEAKVEQLLKEKKI